MSAETPQFTAAATVAPSFAATPADESERLPQNGELDVDSDVYSCSDAYSETTSISSSHIRGKIVNGRRYQSLTDVDYYMPSDSKQYESAALTHLMYLVLDSQKENPLFRSPLSDSATNVLDLGTGGGEFAIDVADRYPNLNVHGVDLSPPDHTWLPENCTLELDDITRPWTWNQKFDLIHGRYLTGAFTESEFNDVYKQAFEHLVPGGFFEEMEGDIGFYCDDNTLPEDSVLADKNHKSVCFKASQNLGRPLDATEHMAARLEAAGFINIKVQDYKVPIGAWPRHPLYKEAGRIKHQEVKTGIEGWMSFLLTTFAEPKWSTEEVAELLQKYYKDLDAGYHIYQRGRRVWAQKPFDA